MTEWLPGTGGAVLALLVLSAIISGSETAYTAVSKPRLFALVNQNNPSAKRVWRILEQPRKFIGAVLLANNAVNILASSLMTVLSLELFGQHGALYATAIVTVLVVIFGEIMPKSIALTKPNETAMFVSRFISVLVAVAFPIVAVLQFIVDIFFKTFGFQTKGLADDETARAELRGAIDLTHTTGAVHKDEKDRLGGLLDLRDLDVSDVMIHRKDMTIMDADLPMRKLIKEILATPYTRIPLYRDNPENIVGVLHSKDLLRALAESDADSINVDDIMRKPWYIPDTTPVPGQLNKFLTRRNHFAIVVDEYGVLQGLITLEDILEEIVGDIRDEHDIDIPGLRKQPDGTFVADGKTAIRDLNRKTDWNLPDNSYTTVAGLVIHESRTIPERGQSFIFFGVRFEILERERNQIMKIRLSSVSETLLS